MSGSLNKVMLIGNLGRDPEVRSTQSGDKVANLSIATSERWSDRDGNRQEKTEWHRVVIFGKVAEVAERYLKKGSKVLIEGKLQTRKWTDQTGAEKYTTEIIVSGFGGNMTMLDSRPGEGGGPQMGYDAPSAGGMSSGGYADARGGADLDDDIPF